MAYTTIDDPSAYFTTTLWTGSGTSSGRSITNSANAGNFQPDWLWIKPRTGTNATHHQLYDSSRGVSKSLRSSATAAEIASSAYGHVSAFDTNGFTSVAGSNNNENINENSSTYVAWQWKANGGTTSSNTDGSITSTVQANTTAGFSIVTHTGNATNGATIGHGLGVVPQVIIKKNRSDSSPEWNVYHHSIGNTKSLFLNTTDAATTESAYNNTSPTSSIQTINGSNANNGDGDNMVVYFFTPIKGYSKFGSYTGNGNADGAFVYTGFKPAWLLFKQSSAAGENWRIFDNKRSPSNQVDDHLFSSNSGAESAETGCDFLSNGFKWRNSDAHQNGNGATYIYMAFAEHPFVSSKGVPVTAR